MGKFIDKILFSIALLAVVYVFAAAFVERRLAVYLSGSVYLAVATLFCVIKAKHINRTDITPSELPVMLALMGSQKATELFYATLPAQHGLYIRAPYFAYERKGQKYLVCVAYKFINLTQEDIAGAYREAVKNGIEHVFILARAKDRKTLTLGAILPITLEYPDKYAVYKYLKRHNALPEKPKKNKKQRVKPDLRALGSVILEPRKAKYYLFLALTFALLALFTPLKTYYLVFAIVPLTLSGISLISNL